MKLKIALLFFIACLPFLSHAQGCITVFSEDGDRFYLVLNGQKQNSTPQTNVRIDGLTGEFYNAKILFEDAAKPEITKNIPTKDPATSQFAEVTYKIKKTKDGELKLRYFSATPVPVNYTPPPDMYSAHYGQAAPPPPPPAPVQSSGTVTQTTVTTTDMNTPPLGASMNVGVGGVNVSINMNDANVNTSVTKTTTTRTTTTTTDNGYSTPPPPPPAQPAQPVRAGCQYPMDFGSFKSAKDAISKASFEETKLSTAKTILASNCVSTDQVMQICKLFGFEASKLDFAKFAYPKTTDPGNYFKVGTIFDFDASKTDLNDYIANNPR